MDHGRRGGFELEDVEVPAQDRTPYLRAHGRNARGYTTGRSVAERFDHEYSGEELREIAGRAATLGKDAEEVRVMFNNNSDYAPRAALGLRELLGQPVAAA